MTKGWKSPWKLYTWYDDGWVCRGNAGIGPMQASDLCSHAMYQYSAPNNDFGAIRGIGNAEDTGRHYAWYADSTFTRGTSDNLTAFYGKYAFSRPAKPGGGTFSMNELIEVDNSPNGHWYFYWKSGNTSGNTVYRTTGSSDDGDRYSQATPVTVANDHGYIVGISFNFWGDCSVNPCKVYDKIVAWYSDGFLNESSSSLNLAQP